MWWASQFIIGRIVEYYNHHSILFRTQCFHPKCHRGKTTTTGRAVTVYRQPTGTDKLPVSCRLRLRIVFHLRYMNHTIKQTASHRGHPGRARDIRWTVATRMESWTSIWFFNVVTEVLAPKLIAHPTENLTRVRILQQARLFIGTLVPKRKRTVKAHTTAFN